MKGPIQTLPLAVCDPNTITEEDIVMTDMLNGGIPADLDTIRILMLKYNPAHKWYFYPEMTKDEVLVFKQFEIRHEDGDKSRIPVFHTAFVDPFCPKDAERRYSFEYRMSYTVPN